MEVGALQLQHGAPSPILGLGGKSLELRELRCFLSVARTGNFGRAARELNVGQPAVSHQMRKLEEGLGTQLLIRHGKGVTLTDAGSKLCDRIDQVLQLLATPLAADSVAPADPGVVTFAVSAELALLLVPALIAEFRSRWPAVRLDIREGDSTDLAELVQNRRADIAVIQDPYGFPDLETCPVVSEALGLVIAPRSRLADDPSPIRLRDIAELPMILPDQHHWIRRRLDQAMFQAGARLTAAEQVDSVALTKTMVRSGLGSTVLPAIAVQDELARGVLAFRPITRPSLLATHAVTYHREACSPAVLDLIQLSRAAMVSLANRGAWAGAELVGGSADSVEAMPPRTAELAELDAPMR
jgi:LysR family transcriptional regulator, nitrogen assimilation regulatory protein